METKPDYLTLEQALDRDFVQITEMDQAGSVPELRLINKGKKKVLIVEGEELVGAKQNRIVNATFLIAGQNRSGYSGELCGAGALASRF